MADKIKVNFNIDKEIWERFKEICKWQDVTASQRLRSFIRDAVLAEAELPKKDREKIEEHLRKLGYIK